MAQRNWKMLAFAPVLAVGLVAGFACGGGDDDSGDSGSSNTPPAVATQAGGSATTPATNGNGGSTTSEVPDGAPLVDQEGLAFKPGELTVKAGEKVYFKNSETAVHTVDINGKNESGTMKRNDVFVYTFDAPGKYNITCEYHPQMKATITVE